MYVCMYVYVCMYLCMYVCMYVLRDATSDVFAPTSVRVSLDFLQTPTGRLPGMMQIDSEGLKLNRTSVWTTKTVRIVIPVRVECGAA